ncbi:MAG: type II toxin-antitoxin system VapC family toxin [Pseudomonadota bacterium]
MTLVVDATVVVAALSDAGEAGQWAESIIAGGSLAAPALVLVESANVLRRLERAKDLSALEVNTAHRDLLQLEIELFPYEPFAPRVWDLRHNVSSYDAWYVALAEALGSELATLDGRLGRASGPTCGFLTPGS